MANACVFCGSTSAKITGEHVIPVWVSKLYSNVGKVTVEIIRRDGSTVSFSIDPFEHKVNVVCNGCNNGWMSTLETDVIPVLGPMIGDGRSTTLDPPTQELIATWAVKTAYMLEYFHPVERIVPDAEYELFYRMQQPSPSHCIWAGHRRSLVNSEGLEQFVDMLEEPIGTVTVADSNKEQFLEAHGQGCRAYRVTYTIGHVVFCVFGFNYPVPITCSVPNENVAQRIWPVQGDLVWPPPVAVDEIGGIPGLHKLFSIPPAGQHPVVKIE